MKTGKEVFCKNPALKNKCIVTVNVYLLNFLFGLFLSWCTEQIKITFFLL
jgi:hypothetical protein